jgi:hypothetical protein
VVYAYVYCVRNVRPSAPFFREPVAGG